jgi:hypothetical protein
LTRTAKRLAARLEKFLARPQSLAGTLAEVVRLMALAVRRAQLVLRAG